MSDRVDGGRPLYLQLEPDPVFAFVHEPESASDRPAAIGAVLCPPFGWDDECSYRARRAWADTLAGAGHPAIRIDLPGTGDSAGSPRDSRRLEAWTSAVADAARWLREELGCARVVAIGIGLGGILACRATASGAGIDDLLLWAVPARGRALVRELRARAQLEMSAEPDADGTTERSPEDEFEVTGQLLTHETMTDLEGIDLTALAFDQGPRRRALLLERDGIAPDRRLREHLEQAGIAVTVAPGDGYGEMMDDPRLTRAPEAVIARSISWLADAPAVSVAGDQAGTVAPVRAGQTLELEHDGTAITETPVMIDRASGRMFGILTEPVGGSPAGLCALLMNAGSIRRIGPNRMWVELARRWAARGVPSLRIDFDAIGDADGAERQYLTTFEFFVPTFTERAIAALDEVAARGVADRFIVVGLCSGAYWALHCGLADERVASAMAVNLDTFFWSPDVAAKRIAGRARRGRTRRQMLRSALAWKGIREGAVWLKLSVRGGRRGGRRAVDQITGALDLLRVRHTDFLLLFSRGELNYDELVAGGWIEHLERWPNTHVDHIPGDDHMVRAIRLQRYVHRILDQALDRVLDAAEPAPVMPPDAARPIA